MCKNVFKKWILNLVFSSQDIPIEFNITLLKNAPNPFGVLSSKASGEPPLAAATCVFTAVRNAIQSAMYTSPIPILFCL